MCNDSLILHPIYCIKYTSVCTVLYHYKKTSTSLLLCLESCSCVDPVLALEARLSSSGGLELSPTFGLSLTLLSGRAGTTGLEFLDGVVTRVLLLLPGSSPLVPLFARAEGGPEELPRRDLDFL